MRLSLPTIVCIFLTLTACAPTYIATGAGPGTDDNASSDYKKCANKVLDEYYDKTPFYEREGFTAGAIGGPILGTIYTASTPPSTTGKELDAKTDACMVSKGYVMKKDAS